MLRSAKLQRHRLGEVFVLLLAAVFALPSCFTYMLWDEKEHSLMPPPPRWGDVAMAAGEDRRVYIAIGEAARANWAAALPLVTPATQALALELERSTDLARLRALATAPEAKSWLWVHVSVRGEVTAKLVIGTQGEFPCRLHAVTTATTAPSFAPLGVHVWRDQPDGTPVVTRILLTPFAVVLDVVFLPFSVLGFFSLLGSFSL